MLGLYRLGDPHPYPTKKFFIRQKEKPIGNIHQFSASFSFSIVNMHVPMHGFIGQILQRLSDWIGT